MSKIIDLKDHEEKRPIIRLTNILWEHLKTFPKWKRQQMIEEGHEILKKHKKAKEEE